MSNAAGQRTRNRETAQTSGSGDDGASALEETRADTDRLFRVASRSFEAMRQGSSEEFLRRSRQTGGQ